MTSFHFYTVVFFLPLKSSCKMTTFYISSVFLILSAKLICGSVDVNLVFYLEDLIQSDVILIAKNNENDGNEKLVKKFLKHENIEKRGFIGVIDIQKNFKMFAEKKFLSPYQNTMIIIDENSQDSIEKLINIQNVKLMASVIWISFTEDVIGDNFYIPFHSRFYIIRKISVLRYEIEDVYQISERTPKIYTPFAVWENGSLNVFQNDSYGRRMDLRGHQFNVAEHHYSGVKDKVEILWKLFSAKMNFSINWQRRKSGQLLSNGTAVGSFKDVLERKVDGTPSHELYLKSRADVFDYIFPAWKIKSKFFLKLNSQFNWASFIAPFSVHVYLSIFIWIVISSSIIHLIIRLKCKKILEPSILTVIRALFWQGGSPSTSNLSVYISYLMPYLLTIILTQYYLGSLSSYLSVKQANIPFKNLKEIINDGSYKIIVYRTSYLYLYFKTDHGPEATAIRNRNLMVEYEKLPLNVESGLRLICQNRWILVNYVTSLAVKEECEIVELDEPFLVFFTGIMVWKGFPYKDVMTKIMKRLQFGGLAELLLKSARIKYEAPDVFEPFSMELVYPIFLLHLSVIILSLVILLCELSWKCLKRCNNVELVRNSSSGSSQNVQPGAINKAVVE